MLQAYTCPEHCRAALDAAMPPDGMQRVQSLVWMVLEVVGKRSRVAAPDITDVAVALVEDSSVNESSVLFCKDRI
jgi:hypothetical protein